MKKYLLSTGKVTEKLEDYVVDLFKLYLTVNPNDIPGAPGIGFDFTITQAFKADLSREVESRVGRLVQTIQDQFKTGVTIELTSCELIDEQLARIVVTVNKKRSEEIEFNVYD